MNSFRCPQCNLLNFASALQCKRCKYEFGDSPDSGSASDEQVLDQQARPDELSGQPQKPVRSEPLPEYVPVALPIGGWLVLWAVSLALTPFVGAYSISKYLEVVSSPAYQQLTDPHSKLYLPTFAPLMTLEFGLVGGTMIAALILLVRLFQRSSSFPRLVIAVMAIQCAALILDFMMGVHVDSTLTQKFSELGMKGSTIPHLNLLRSAAIDFIVIVSSMIWTAYFLKSQRVEATFIY